MNESINLVEILKNCPKGTKLYSTISGTVGLLEVLCNSSEPYPIKTFEYNNPSSKPTFTSEGKYSTSNGECVLFPSKEQRDWSKFKVKKPKFDPKTLQPFDRILIRDRSNGKWSCSLFSHIDNELQYPSVCANGLTWKCCIPYNEETEHLVGTNNEAPEYYRYWED